MPSVVLSRLGPARGETQTEKGQPPMAFDALTVALQINQHVAPLAQEIRQHDPDMARQIRRAAQSIPANLAEGRKRVGDRKSVV